MYDAYLNLKDTLHLIAVVFEAVQFIALDPENTDLTYELIAWVLETVAHAPAVQHNPLEGKNA